MLSLMDLDTFLLELKPAASKEYTFVAVMAKFEKWDMANRLSLMIINRLSQIPFAIWGSIPDKWSAKDFLDAVWEKFVALNKPEVAT